MVFTRSIKLAKFKTSLFLFGPRLTGKTTLLRQYGADFNKDFSKDFRIKKRHSAEYFDLLDPERELEYKSRPGLFWEQISALPEKSLVLVDEIQRVPALLDYAQKGIDQLHLRFILSGSSARKLRRGGANLLGGRAVDVKLHPLTYVELGSGYAMSDLLSFGSLPLICSLLKDRQSEAARQHLKSYITTYIREEIQAEALLRNLGAFNRFLNVAAQSNGQVIEFANISRECSVPMSTVKEYYQILEDTLLGFFLWPWDRSERKKARPKFYFFDCGVVRAMQNRLNDPPTPQERGYLFETWLVNELGRLRDYGQKEHQLSFWRQRDQEIDVVISGNRGPILCIECKSGQTDPGVAAAVGFRKIFPKVQVITASLQEQRPRKTVHGDIWPWKKVLEYYRELP